MAADTTNRSLPMKLNGRENSVTGLMAMMLLTNSTVTAIAAMMTSFPENCMGDLKSFRHAVSDGMGSEDG